MSNRSKIDDVLVGIRVADNQLEDALGDIAAACPLAGHEIKRARQLLVAAASRLLDVLQLPIEPLVEHVDRISGSTGTVVDMLPSPSAPPS